MSCWIAALRVFPPTCPRLYGYCPNDCGSHLLSRREDEPAIRAMAGGNTQ